MKTEVKYYETIKHISPSSHPLLPPTFFIQISDIFESIKAAHISLVEGSELDDMMKEWALEAVGVKQ